MQRQLHVLDNGEWDGSGIQTHVVLSLLQVMLLLPLSFGTGTTRSPWHHVAGACALLTAAAQLVTLPARGSTRDLPSAEDPGPHVALGVSILVGLLLQGCTGAALFLAKRAGERVLPWGWRHATLPPTQKGLATAAFAWRHVLLPVHGVVGAALPWLGFAQVFVAVDMLWGMCHHGHNWQCLSHIGLTALSTPMGLMALASAAYPHTRLLLHASTTRGAGAAGGGAAPPGDEAERAPLVAPPNESKVAAALRLGDGDHAALPNDGRAPLAPLPLLGSAAWGREAPDPLAGGAGSSRTVLLQRFLVAHHYAGAWPTPRASWFLQDVLRAWLFIPGGVIVFVAHWVLSQRAVAATIAEFAALRAKAVAAGKPPPELPPPGVSHSDLQHTSLGVMGLALLLLELVLRHAPRARAGSALAAAWRLPRAAVIIAIGWAMGLHHQHDAMAVMFHTEAGIMLSLAGVVQLLALAGGLLLPLPEEAEAAAALRRAVAGGGASELVVAASSPAAQRLVALARVGWFLEGFAILFAGIMFVGSSPSTQHLAMSLMPGGWSPGTWFVLATVICTWFAVIASLSAAGARAPAWRELRPLLLEDAAAGAGALPCLRAACCGFCCAARSKAA